MRRIRRAESCEAVTSEEWSCRIKVRHANLGAARAAMHKTLRTHGLARGQLTIYECRFCHGWHVGHSNPHHLKVKRMERK